MSKHAAVRNSKSDPACASEEEITDYVLDILLELRTFAKHMQHRRGRHRVQLAICEVEMEMLRSVCD